MGVGLGYAEGKLQREEEYFCCVGDWSMVMGDIHWSYISCLFGAMSTTLRIMNFVNGYQFSIPPSIVRPVKHCIGFALWHKGLTRYKYYSILIKAIMGKTAPVRGCTARGSIQMGICMK